MHHKNIYTERITMNYLINVSAVVLLSLFADVRAMENQQPQTPTMKEKRQKFEKECVEKAMQKRENPNKKNNDGESAFPSLLLDGELLPLDTYGELLPLDTYKEMAITGGFDFKSADYNSGWTLLHRAAEKRDLLLSKWLIEEQKVDINALCAHWLCGRPLATTPLDYVFSFGRLYGADEKFEDALVVISCLSEHGAQFSGNWLCPFYNLERPRVLQTYVPALSTKKKQKFCSYLKKESLKDVSRKKFDKIRASIAILEQSLR
jgi:hypothetical protein